MCQTVGSRAPRRTCYTQTSAPAALRLTFDLELGMGGLSVKRQREENETGRVGCGLEQSRINEGGLTASRLSVLSPMGRGGAEARKAQIMAAEI